MENAVKLPRHTVYAVLDTSDHWKRHKEFGFYLVYDTEEMAIEGMKQHGGAKVIKATLYWDGDGKSEEVARNE